ncbi:hypothetical protein T439DRAFT_369186 [Meredithblackwellia eburnea MCA 4105]
MSRSGTPHNESRGSTSRSSSTSSNNAAARRPHLDARMSVWEGSRGGSQPGIRFFPQDRQIPSQFAAEDMQHWVNERQSPYESEEDHRRSRAGSEVPSSHGSFPSGISDAELQMAEVVPLRSLRVHEERRPSVQTIRPHSRDESYPTSPNLATRQSDLRQISLPNNALPHMVFLLLIFPFPHEFEVVVESVRDPLTGRYAIGLPTNNDREPPGIQSILDRFSGEFNFLYDSSGPHLVHEHRFPGGTVEVFAVFLSIAYKEHQFVNFEGRLRTQASSFFKAYNWKTLHNMQTGPERSNYRLTIPIQSLLDSNTNGLPFFENPFDLTREQWRNMWQNEAVEPSAIGDAVARLREATGW